MKRNMLLIGILVIAGLSYADDKVIRIGSLPVEDKVIRIQPVSMTNALVQTKAVDTATEITPEIKQGNYRFQKPVQAKSMYKDVLICKHGYCRVVKVLNQ